MIAIAVIAGSPVEADDRKVDPAELKALRAAPLAWRDAAGHYFVFPDLERAVTTRYVPGFYGDRTGLYRFAHVQHDEHHVTSEAGPHGMNWRFRLIREDQSVIATCGRRNVKLTPVPAAEAKKLVASASFQLAPTWERDPLRLARDDLGVYYYVDRTGSTDHRLYVGRRGALARMKLRDVVIDSAGELFITETGTFKINSYSTDPTGSGRTQRYPQAWWVVGGKRSELTLVDTFADRELIFSDLGIYTSEKMGTPCDVF